MIKYDAIVIGAGAAGILAAATAAQKGAKVLLLDRNARMARKVMITGKGRCNVTNRCTAESFLQNVCSNPKFLLGPISRFSPKETMDLFEGLGVPLKTERGDRVFPVSDKAVDIVDALVRHAGSSGVIFQQERVLSLILEEGCVKGVRCESEKVFYSDRIVVATGGKSYPLTGSSGDGYDLASQAGHKIVAPRASLIPVATEEEWCRDCMGLSLKNVTLSLWEKGKKKPLYSELGEMLFTHFGVSGPLVLTASTYMKKDISNYRLEIDLKPGLSFEQLQQRVLRDFENNINRDFFNSLSDLLPRKLIPVLVRLSKIPGTEKVHQITREQRESFCHLLKHLPLTPKSLLPVEEAIVTAGGVSVKEIVPQTMESKLCKGLYFAGEVMDLDARTGGFNLQIAFTTGFVAGESIGKEVLECTQ
ncbi:MAG: NAD(P)/FAD-dependent oxidoreductase [Oscillospiraceae bacterium]|nr:NAD(P)/FAD-dependent oxidoreductase [Oscillospiraceae bacterium]